jgi:hypothetical protein
MQVSCKAQKQSREHYIEQVLRRNEYCIFSTSVIRIEATNYVEDESGPLIHDFNATSE